MARQRRFLEIDVLEAAKQRIHHIYDLHDSVAVCFSGGKDSLVALHLVKQVAEERGEGLPIPVIFRDEELIPDAVIDFVNEYRQLDWIDMRWYAVPLASQKFILGRVHDYVQWDPDREIKVRPCPEWALTDAPPGHVFSQFDMDGFTARDLPGKVAFITGIRAAESIMRYRASVNKLNDSYINASSDARVSLCKPIYDWQEDDVFKFFMEEQVRFCPLYDGQHYAGTPLRISTPIHAEASKKLGDLRSIDPEFYDRVLAAFPDMDVQDRYWSQLDRAATTERWGQSYDTIDEYIRTQIPDHDQRRKAAKMFRSVMVRARRQPDAYPPHHVFRYIYTGAFKRKCLPLGKREQKPRTKR